MIRIKSVLGAVALAVLSTGAWVATGALHTGQAIAQEQAPDTSSIIDMTIGAEDAPIEMIEYASYTCPHCRAFHEDVFKKLKTEYIDTGKVKFTYREVYFDRFGLWASMIARCAGPDRFFGVNDLLYAGQTEWTRAGGGDPAAIVEELRKIGRLAGLGNEELDACMQDGDKARTLVAWYQENAEADDVKGTPSFVINGKKVSNMSWSDFQAYLDSELGS